VSQNNRLILLDAIDGMSVCVLSRKYDKNASTIKASLLMELKLVLTKPIHDDVSFARACINSIVRDRIIKTKLNTIPINVIHEHALAIRSLISTFDKTQQKLTPLEDVAFLGLDNMSLSKLYRSDVRCIADLKPFIAFYLAGDLTDKEYVQSKGLLNKEFINKIYNHLHDLNLANDVILFEVTPKLYTPLYLAGEHGRRITDFSRKDDINRDRRRVEREQNS
jgi:hypothetical protein